MNTTKSKPQPLSLKDVFMKEALNKAIANLVALIEKVQLTSSFAHLRTLGVHEVENPEGKRLSLIELAPITTSENGQENWSDIKPLTTHAEGEANTLYVLTEPSYAKDIATYLDYKLIQELQELQPLLIEMDEAALMLLMKSNLEAQEARKSLNTLPI